LKAKPAKDLSKGMQQKVQFITAVIHEPDLLILDEPFSGLDPVSVDLMKETILELKDEKKNNHPLNSSDGDSRKTLR